MKIIKTAGNGPNIIDITSQRFGKWVVVKFVSLVDHKSMWLCHCDCGVEKEIAGPSLRSGNSKSCGCRRAEVSRATSATHGMSKTAEYRIWKNIRTRCQNSNVPCYKNYGGRGIKVCSQWDDFSAFFSDMGKRPSLEHSIDRINNDGDYCPENCRWSTVKEQCVNKRTNLFLEHDGVRQTATQWAQQTGIPLNTIRNRIILGWSHKESLSTPSQARCRSIP